jgi:O-antigen/teichoic acid export membrane protein
MNQPEQLGDRRLLSKSEVKHRASAGVFYLASSGFASLVLGFGGSLLLARMLTPRDFGLVAIGATVATFSGALTEGGLGSGMIRRTEPPTGSELRSLNGIQLTFALGLCLPISLIALGFGTAGAVTALMIMALPIQTLQTPGRVMLERALKYDRQAVVDLGALATSQIFSVVAVFLGAGVWGLAAGAVVKSAAGVVLMALVGVGVHAPSFRGWSRLWGVVRFGLSFQSNWIAIVLGEQGLNVIVGAIAGVQVLGLWSLAKKTLQVPALFFNSLMGVVFPAVSSLLAHGDDPARKVLRIVRLSSIASTLIFVPFAAGSTGLIPFLFGEQWRGAARAIPLAVVAALIAGPMAACIGGYLFALGRARPVLVASVASATGAIVVAAPLLSRYGLIAVGAGLVVGALAQAVLLDREAWAVARIRSARVLVAPLTAAIPAGAAGLAVSLARPHSLAVSIAASVIALVLDLAFLQLLCRRDLNDALGLVLGSVRDASGRLRAPSPQQS